MSWRVRKPHIPSVYPPDDSTLYIFSLTTPWYVYPITPIPCTPKLRVFLMYSKASPKPRFIHQSIPF